MPHNLIVFGEDWGALPSSTQHLMKVLAKDRKILWVNSIGLRRPRFTLHDSARVWSKIVRTCKKNKSQDTNLSLTPANITLFNPLTLPAPRTKLERFLAVYLLKKQLKPKIHELNLESFILWTSLPTAADLLGQLGEVGSVYYCGDDFSGLAGVDHSTVSMHEDVLIKKCDLIIAASKKLTQKFPKTKTYELTHGVDFDLFTRSQKIASDMPCNNRPTAGFYGSLSQWIDQELLLEITNKLPLWNFVFIGNEDVDMSLLKKQANTFFLGAKPHSELPRYSQYWQASLLPFRDNTQIRACNPLKLVEYLAAGSPIVCTDFPALIPYKHLVQRANTVEAFVLALELSLHLTFLAQHKNTLVSSVKSNTWHTKAKTVSTWLKAL